MITEFKPGYTLFITSYLGDADYYNTETVTGLTLGQAKLVERFLNACISGYNHPDKSIYSRNSDEIDLYRVAKHFSLEEVTELVKIFYQNLNDVNIDWNDDGLSYLLRDLTYDLMGHGDPHTDYLRTFDSFKVAYFHDSVLLQEHVR